MAWQSSPISVSSVTLEKYVKNSDLLLEHTPLLLEARSIQELKEITTRIQEVLDPVFEKLDFKVLRADKGVPTVPINCAVLLSTQEKKIHPHFTCGMRTSGNNHLDLGLSNLFGRGENLALKHVFSTEETETKISFNAPYFKTKFINGNLSGKVFHNSEDNFSNPYQQKTTGFSLEFSKGPFSLSYDLSHINIALSKDISECLVREGGSHLKSSVSTGVRWAVGTWKWHWMNELAGFFGDVKHWKTDLKFRKIWDLGFMGWLLKFGGEFGWIFNYGRTFISDRFFLGGMNSFRGFEDKGVGPRSTKDSYGGNYFYHLSLLLQYPLLLFPELSSLQGELFIETGDLALQNLTKMRTVAGVGLALNLSQGLDLRCHYCYPISSQWTDATKRFDFGLTAEFL